MEVGKEYNGTGEGRRGWVKHVQEGGQDRWRRSMGVLRDNSRQERKGGVT